MNDDARVDGRPGPVRVLIVDDQLMIRLGLRGILEASDDVTVVGDVADGLLAVERVRTETVDVVLMDVRMPGIDGVEATRRIRAAGSEGSPGRPSIIVLTTFDDDATVLEALRAGADGFLSKGVGPTELVAGIVDVARGGGVLSARATAALIRQVSEATPPVVDAGVAALFDRLTPRERDVVVAAAAGKDNATIAAEMFVSPFTVKTHVSRAMTKVQARDRAQLVAFAYQGGLVP
ncbi:LuxR family transcriptional regulator [Frigoribacterium sp. Leaf164]|uniref:response regulator transcription factor n=1 Tax=Frigoribacterium sp. Leaf164 TaxID=1736282 RepID=UPI0007012B72|nr:response regulator transcription factor [Frigoribacterium sp. Leaf164]KQR46851.1 LuxR family transcriptional regulator [Frigoribacterium sp. Leaf164]